MNAAVERGSFRGRNRFGRSGGQGRVRVRSMPRVIVLCGRHVGARHGLRRVAATMADHFAVQLLPHQQRDGNQGNAEKRPGEENAM